MKSGIFKKSIEKSRGGVTLGINVISKDTGITGGVDSKRKKVIGLSKASGINARVKVAKPKTYNLNCRIRNLSFEDIMYAVAAARGYFSTHDMMREIMKRETRKIVNANPELLKIAKHYWDSNHVVLNWKGIVRRNQNKNLFSDSSKKNKEQRIKEIRENADRQEAE
jgi:hypothetical protein